ncbi:helix-turn-helix domain-containing protein [Alkalihalobacillus pseudalcaliphilus]|uniref:helix-turn-helix domain-containing protein n=1 Tax=Alkalihalobacillus pseudalcaliphilus TaxID=79884 RepID=UPI00064D9003|nr:helix-turn-helix transcriptional regulator [Alkalihalobacillus pseudalcaliphilus]KMK75414.1 hypothetical protein AB990_08840 [Alkalihalobacillus pseudalcaliphilus]
MRYRIKRCRLPELMQKKKLTQADLVVLTGWHKSSINRWRSGEVKMTLPVAKVFAEILGCRIEDLYEWEYVGD